MNTKKISLLSKLYFCRLCKYDVIFLKCIQRKVISLKIGVKSSLTNDLGKGKNRMNVETEFNPIWKIPFVKKIKMKIQIKQGI